MSANTVTPGHNPKNYSKARATVIRYFLRIFKHQINASTQDKSELKRMDVTTFGSKFHTFEMNVEHKGEKESRRMTIAPLGEDSGSKSMCFYVIYDDHLVVKIPPTPITDLAKYLDSIHADQRIVFRLKPRECVVPCVSVILKRVHAFEGENIGPEKIEGKYISWLKNNPEHQEYLKVDDAFVFFMDLSKYSILGDVLARMHQEKDDQVFQEIVDNRGVILEYQNFEGRYGKARASICFDFQEIYLKYEAGIQEIFKQDRKMAASLQYKTEEWFLIHLAERELGEAEKDLSPQLVSEINTLIAGLLEENREIVTRYREMIHSHINKKYFSINRYKMEGIITNTLDLLALLKEKGVAMRDFKPDNLLVTGDPEKNPNFLSAPDEYNLGLIDVETAVIYETHDKIGQPQLGGTPFFATPSQLFSNKFLEETFGDVAGILYLQDWYAAVAMIYYVVTGERLFEQTARLLPVIIKTIQKSVAKKQKTSEFMEKVNRMFWESAVPEFKNKLEDKEKILRSIISEIPGNAKEMLLDNLRNERIYLTRTIKEQVEAQGLFKSEKNRAFLLKSSQEQVVSLRSKWKKSDNPQKAKIIECLNKLEQQKEGLHELDSTMRMLNTPELKLTSYELMEILFNTVFRKMYQNKWGKI